MIPTLLASAIGIAFSAELPPAVEAQFGPSSGRWVAELSALGLGETMPFVFVAAMVVGIFSTKGLEAFSARREAVA